jgi:hypothetical protein
MSQPALLKNNVIRIIHCDYWSSLFGRCNIHCLCLSVLVNFDSKFNTGIFLQRTKSLNFDTCLMNEDVTRVVIWLDETVTFRGVEPGC